MSNTVDKAVPGTTGKVAGDPTKGFFVTMLTRDIDLMDAIMDLIDNCIDGTHRLRVSKENNQNSPYQGFYAEIDIDENGFKIKDNCGGIPFDVALTYAFRMGRSEKYHGDDDLETVGMYGIGMKRAIFKMGEKATITTWNKDDYYKVNIPADWPLRQDWDFEYTIFDKKEIEGLLDSPGTILQIERPYENIKNQFCDVSGFIKNLSILLKNHYGYIIHQGFSLKLNGNSIDPLALNIIASEQSSGKTIQPYVYYDTIEGVDIKVIIGFYRPPATEEEISAEIDGAFAPSQTENAGITILCNDRVVLYCDKTHLTGWGDKPVPKYHTQFISIAGVVHFHSSNPLRLPVTTTKRGIDTSSAIYASVKNQIKEGIKIFTQFTNNWKTPSPERDELFIVPKSINALEPEKIEKNVFQLTHSKKNETGLYQIPVLPKPDDEIRNKFVNISFSREKERVNAIASYFLENKKKNASEIGGWCFDEIYSQVEK